MATFLQLQPDTDYDSSIFTQDVEDAPYTFEIRFNYRLGLWVMTVFDPDGEALASSPLLTGIPLLRLYDREELFQGDILLTDDLNSKNHCGREDLNVLFSLLLSVP